MGEADVLNWLDAKLAEFDELVDRRPADNMPINVNAARLWRHKMILLYGRMVGAIESLATFGHLAPRAAEMMNHRIKGATYRHIARHLTGADQ